MYDKNPSLKKLVSILEDMHAIDMVVIDVSEHTTITDFMIICSGRSSRHVKAIAEEVMAKMKTAGFPAISHTGLANGDWALVDFGHLVLHVMQPNSRLFYNLEGLWQNPTQ